MSNDSCVWKGLSEENKIQLQQALAHPNRRVDSFSCHQTLTYSDVLEQNLAQEAHETKIGMHMPTWDRQREEFLRDQLYLF